jgi:CBS domain-containing protein
MKAHFPGRSARAKQAGRGLKETLDKPSTCSGHPRFAFFKAGEEHVMATVREILARKASPHVLTIAPEATVLEAAILMNKHKIGSLVVIEDERVVGMFTERDILQRVVAERLDSAETLVGDVMTTAIVCCTLETTIGEARGAMKNHRVRHLPLVDNERRLQGLISIGDLNAYETSDHEQTIYHLQEYVYGRV